MKRIVPVVLVALVGLGVLLAFSFRAAPLSLAETGKLTSPPPPATPAVSLSVIHAGRMASVAALAFRGGDFGDERVFGMDAVLVEHPRGSLLIDSGFGRDVDAHFLTNPKLMQKLAQYTPETPVAQQLRDSGRDPSQLMGVILTHAHWDHVSGLADLPGVPVWVPQAELDFIRSGSPMTALARLLAPAITWRVVDFDGGPYLGFDRSHDVFGDGTVVLVPAGGHTPGSTIVFVSLPDGQRYGFIGDLVWQAEGLTELAERPWITRNMVDVQPDDVRARIVQLHQLAAQMPNLLLVPAHDRTRMNALPKLQARPVAAPAEAAAQPSASAG